MTEEEKAELFKKYSFRAYNERGQYGGEVISEFDFLEAIETAYTPQWVPWTLDAILECKAPYIDTLVTLSFNDCRPNEIRQMKFIRLFGFDIGLLNLNAKVIAYQILPEPFKPENNG